MTNLTDRVAIVTGASREIGAAMAETLASDGAAVLLVHHGEPELAEAVVARIAAAGGRAAAYDTDLSSVAANQAMVARAVELYGRVDILAANAGITGWGSFLDAGEAQWDKLVDLNLKGAYFGAQAAAREMVAQGGGGRIVFSSSVTGIRAGANASIYSITKAALQHMARVLAVELGPHGITVNALGIGATLNARNLAAEPDYAETWARLAPAGRVGQPQDIAEALRYLVSPAAAMVTGHTLVVDGGWAISAEF